MRWAHGEREGRSSSSSYCLLRAEPLLRLILPVLTSLVSTLPLKGVAPRLASATLEALGELAQATHSSLTPWVEDLLRFILKTIQYQSSASKQRTRLRTLLGQINGSTGYVITPYLDYPTAILSCCRKLLMYYQEPNGHLGHFDARSSRHWESLALLTPTATTRLHPRREEEALLVANILLNKRTSAKQSKGMAGTFLIQLRLPSRTT